MGAISILLHTTFVVVVFFVSLVIIIRVNWLFFKNLRYEKKQNRDKRIMEDLRYGLATCQKNRFHFVFYWGIWVFWVSTFFYRVIFNLSWSDFDFQYNIVEHLGVEILEVFAIDAYTIACVAWASAPALNLYRTEVARKKCHG